MAERMTIIVETTTSSTRVNALDFWKCILRRVITNRSIGSSSIRCWGKLNLSKTRSCDEISWGSKFRESDTCCRGYVIKGEKRPILQEYPHSFPHASWASFCEGGIRFWNSKRNLETFWSFWGLKIGEKLSSIFYGIKSVSIECFIFWIPSSIARPNECKSASSKFSLFCEDISGETGSKDTHSIFRIGKGATFCVIYFKSLVETCYITESRGVTRICNISRVRLHSNNGKNWENRYHNSEFYQWISDARCRQFSQNHIRSIQELLSNSRARIGFIWE